MTKYYSGAEINKDEKGWHMWHSGEEQKQREGFEHKI
jgi:hypothetical protein